MNIATCLICHEDVRVPVQFTCFNCPTNNRDPSCNDFIRVCMMCARDYLELNKVPRERKGSCKCLICNTRVNPQNLSGAGSCYKKDYCYMRLDSRTNYPCFHSEKGCEFTGTQQQLDNHIQTTCQYRMTSCPCGTLYRVCDIEQHRASCHYYRLCPDCDRYVLNTDFKSHLFENHSKMICPYEGCNKIMTYVSIDIHTKKCEYRTVTCSICSLTTTRALLIQHSRQHIETEQEYISRLMKDIDLSMERIKTAKQTYNDLRLEESDI